MAAAAEGTLSRIAVNPLMPVRIALLRGVDRSERLGSVVPDDVPLIAVTDKPFAAIGTDDEQSAVGSKCM